MIFFTLSRRFGKRTKNRTKTDNQTMVRAGVVAMGNGATIEIKANQALAIIVETNKNVAILRNTYLLNNENVCSFNLRNPFDIFE